jgi:hypothetical protein
MKKLIESIDRLSTETTVQRAPRVNEQQKYSFLHDIINESTDSFTAFALEKLDQLAQRRNMSVSNRESLRQSIIHNFTKYGETPETIQKIIDSFSNRIRKNGDWSKYDDVEAIRQSLNTAYKKYNLSRTVDETKAKLEKEFQNFIADWDEHTKLSEYGSVGTGAPMQQPVNQGNVAQTSGNVTPMTGNVAAQPNSTTLPSNTQSPQAGGTQQGGTQQGGTQQTAPVTPEQLAKGFLVGMGNKNPSQAEIASMSKMLGTGLSKIR